MAVNEDIDLEHFIARVANATPADKPLERLGTARTVAARLECTAQHLVAQYVDEARRNGASWTDIGAALGVTRQAAQQRFVPAPGADIDAIAQDTAVPLSSRTASTLHAARKLATELNHPDIDDLHILLALLDSRNSGATNAVKAAGRRVGEIRKAARVRLAAEGARKSLQPPALGRTGARVIPAATREALRLGSDTIRSEHVLLALTSDSSSAAGLALAEADVHYETLRTYVS